MQSAASRKSSALGSESASTKKIQSPRARAAPALRARPIWFTGSNTTSAPARSAISAVRSFELLSHTISSDSQPSRANPSAAARVLEGAPGSNRCSLNAGTTTEILISLAPVSAYYRFGECQLDRDPDPFGPSGERHVGNAGSEQCRCATERRVGNEAVFHGLLLARKMRSECRASVTGSRGIAT